MKILLTSAGLKNDTIRNTVKELTNSNKIKTAFIPTAANFFDDDKSWLIEDLNEFSKLGEIDIVDISAIKKEDTIKRLESSNVIVLGGGDTTHLMREIIKFDLENNLKRILENKLLVGISAGSMITNPELALKISQDLYDSDLDETEEMNGLNYVDFYFVPHLNSKWFSKVTKENIERLAKNSKRTIYALDDNSAIKIIDNNIEIISEGEWLKFEK